MADTNKDKIEKTIVPALDEILGKKFPVLDDGFVRLIDYLGDDAAIVQAARVSYGAGTKKRSVDRELIRYLMRHRHTSPFEMCELKLHIRCPMDCWRQWIRHRTANVNEYSTRYSIAIDAAATTGPDAWRLQDTVNIQGSAGLLDEALGHNLSEREAQIQKMARETYEDRLAHGVAREQARKDLPLSTYTEAYWKIDLHNLLHVLALRMDAHAQQEIRAYATVIGEEIVARWVPVTWEAFLDYRRNAMTLSSLEAALVSALAAGDTARASAIAADHGIVNRRPDGRLAPNVERAEIDVKLRALGWIPPWEAAQ
jgi:thymidylate synthase (FAD)